MSLGTNMLYTVRNVHFKEINQKIPPKIIRIQICERNNSTFILYEITFYKSTVENWSVGIQGKYIMLITVLSLSYIPTSKFYKSHGKLAKYIWKARSERCYGNS